MGRWRHFAFSTNDYYGVYGVYGIGVLDRFSFSSKYTCLLALFFFFCSLFSASCNARDAWNGCVGFHGLLGFDAHLILVIRLDSLSFSS